MINHFWGAVFLLLPFCFKISSVRPDMRQGLDFIFLTCTAISLMFFGGAKLPFKYRVTASILLASNLLFNFDFNSYYGFSSSVFFIGGIIFVAHLYFNYYELNKFESYIRISGFVGLICLILNSFDVHLRNLLITGFYPDIIFKQREFGDLPGMLRNANLSGAHLALTIPAFMNKKNYKFAIIPVTGVLMTSTWPKITALAIVLYYGWRYIDFPKYMPYIGFVLAIFAVFFLSDRSVQGFSTGRFSMWEISFNYFMMKGSWLFGNGLGWFGEIFPTHYRPFRFIFRQEHNEYLTTLYAFGFSGLACVLYWFIEMAKTKCVATSAAIFGIFVNMACNFTVHMSPLFILVAYWAVKAIRERHDTALEW